MFSQSNQLELSSARTAWRVLEPYHAKIYFAPEAREAYVVAGLKGFWIGYFASRATTLDAIRRREKRCHPLKTPCIATPASL